MPYTRPVKFKAAHGFKGPYDFEQVKVVQDLSGEHMVSCLPVAWLEGLRMQSFSAGLVNQDCRSGQGAVWTMKFSHCGRLLASAGQDNLVRIWVLKTAFDYFNNMRMKYNSEGTSSFWAWAVGQPACSAGAGSGQFSGEAPFSCFPLLPCRPRLPLPISGEFELGQVG